jgi:hypothetical protein
VIVVLVLDINKIIPKINILVLVLSLFLGIIFAQGQTSPGLIQLQDAMKTICGQVYNLLPPVAMLLVIAGAVTYAAGQFAGAEMRARATGWATAMIIGALFAFVIVLLLPSVVMALNNQPGTDWRTYCQ